MAPPDAGWSALGEAIATARGELAAIASDTETAAAAEAYLLRVVTSSLNGGLLGHLFTQGGLTRAIATFGGPNSDYIMLHAPVDPTGRYRLEGQLNGSERVGVGLYTFGPAGESIVAGYVAYDATTPNFSLELGSDLTGPGTLSIAPTARALLIRILHRQPGGQPATLSLTGGGRPDLVLGGGSGEAALKQAAFMTLRTVRQFIQWSRLTSANPNRFGVPQELAEEVIGDPDTTYLLGYYALDDGERLDVTVPAGLPGYWSLHAYNHWCESLPGAGVHDRNAKSQPDGSFTVSIGPSLAPDLSNRIDTLGRKRGVLIFRTIGAAGAVGIDTQVRRG